MKENLDNITLAILAVCIIAIVGIFAAPDEAEAVSIISYCVTAIAGLASGKALSK